MKETLEYFTQNCRNKMAPRKVYLQMKEKRLEILNFWEQFIIQKKRAEFQNIPAVTMVTCFFVRAGTGYNLNTIHFFYELFFASKKFVWL